MKIGIISDTHSKVALASEALDMLIENGAEFIIHAGDIVETETLELLKNCGKKYVAVYGNNDAHLVAHHNKYNLVQEPHYFKLADTKFKLMHLPYYMSPDAEIVIFGHTHTFESDFKNGTLFLNPGEICARSKPLSECAMLNIKEDKFKLTYYSKDKNTSTYNKQKFSYERESHE